MNKFNRILIVDDEPSIIELLEYNLSKAGYEVRSALNGKDGIEIVRAWEPNIILLDIMMPGMDGVETCRQIREVIKLKDAFVIFLTARSEEYSEIAAFDAGANDYITKPVKPRALLSRIDAFFRRESMKEGNSNSITLNGLTIDRDSFTVLKGKEKVILAKKEFELLYFLCQHPNKIFNRDELLRNVWGTDIYVVSRTVDVHIRKIREKVGDSFINTVKGIGYKLNVAD